MASWISSLSTVSLTHSHTLTLSLSHSLTHSLTLSYCLALSISLTLAVWLSHSRSLLPWLHLFKSLVQYIILNKILHLLQMDSRSNDLLFNTRTRMYCIIPYRWPSILLYTEPIPVLFPFFFFFFFFVFFPEFVDALHDIGFQLFVWAKIMSIYC